MKRKLGGKMLRKNLAIFGGLVLAGLLPPPAQARSTTASLEAKCGVIDTYDSYTMGRDKDYGERHRDAVATARAACDALVMWPGLDARTRARAYDHSGSLWLYTGGTYEVSLAVDDFTAAIRLDPQLAQAWYHRGWAYNQANFQHPDVAAAIADYSQAIALKPGYVAPRLERADAYQSGGAYEPAIADLTAAIALQPRVFYIHTRRGMAYQETGDSDRALADFNAAVALARGADAVRQYLVRGDFYLARHDYGHAIGDYSAAVKLGPERDWALRSRGTAYYAAGDYDHAIADFTAAMTGDPAVDLEAYAGRCRARAWAGKDSEAALKDCDLGDSAEFDVLDSRAVIELRLGRSQAAWDDFNKAAESRPDDAIAIYGRGVAAGRLGRDGEADRQAAMSLDSGVSKSYVTMGLMSSGAESAP